MNTPQDHFETLLRDVARAGVYHLPHSRHGGHDDIVAAAENCAYVMFRVDLSRAADKQGLLAAIGRDMAFPEWFGSNWDALADCLNDLGWRPGEGYLVLLEHCDLLHERAANELATALQVFEEAANSWREQGVALWCLVDMQADGIAWLPGL
ncbi:MAG: barstar family protein [Proteobacteria bacterium]|nr:barstar family protein [Pseudomonadota bacterium]